MVDSEKNCIVLLRCALLLCYDTIDAMNLKRKILSLHKWDMTYKGRTSVTYVGI